MMKVYGLKGSACMQLYYSTKCSIAYLSLLRSIHIADFLFLSQLRLPCLVLTVFLVQAVATPAPSFLYLILNNLLPNAPSILMPYLISAYTLPSKYITYYLRPPQIH